MRPIWKQLREGFQTISNVVSGVISILRGNPIAPELQKSLAAGGLMSTVTGIANFIKAVFGGVKGFISGALTVVGPVFCNLFSALAPVATYFISFVKTA